MIESFSIPKNVMQVVDILHKNNFETYLVGGCVRDLVLERTPKRLGHHH